MKDVMELAGDRIRKSTVLVVCVVCLIFGHFIGFSVAESLGIVAAFIAIIILRVKVHRAIDKILN